MKLLVSADFHGNYNHCKTIKVAVDRFKPDIFVHAGDYCPTRLKYSNPSDAIDYLEEHFFKFIKELDVPYKFTIAGNTDLMAVTDHFVKKYQNPSEVKMCTDDFFDFPNFRLIFLSTVPATQKCLKDSEAEEMFNPLKEKSQNSLVFSKTRIEEGMDAEESSSVMASDGLSYDSAFFQVFTEISAVPEQYQQKMKFTIYERLNKLNANNNKPIVLISHAPCYNTIADSMSKRGRILHEGSHDIREFIATHDVVANVSGHIHQSVLVAKAFKQTFDDTSKYIFTVGNSGSDEHLCERCNYIAFSTDNIQDGEYLQFEVEPGFPDVRRDRNFKQ